MKQDKNIYNADLQTEAEKEDNKSNNKLLN